MLSMIRLVKPFLVFGCIAVVAGPAFAEETDASANTPSINLPAAASSGVDQQALDKIRDQAGSVDTDKLEADAKAATQNLKMPDQNSAQAAEAAKAAQRAADTFNSAEFQNRVQEMQNHMAVTEKSKDPDAPPANSMSGTFKAGERVYVFLSSSMPEEDVHAYLLSISRAGEPRIVPVFYGMVGGFANMQNQGKFFGAVLREDYDCVDTPSEMCRRVKVNIQMNPTLFARYSVTDIPTVVFDDGKNTWSVDGNASLSYQLEKINRDAKNPSLAQVVKQLEKAQ